ncbi:bifunctional 2-polyprenyl-6-hydroxyphenol methylase/3-demethylubiquinol 3-O-methyltransferase UbiG [uncultured Pseudokineococcus sp.]|uniref:class I SAM-dependent methyltransferase n=1 Tax=uncultured Pseudokineococcus sp. TaxID=1642928 RepID=UPI00262ABF20|nr:class I SAM-dependent methyltransferase [uncultured Pseudokineococcus sp.]
MTAPDPAPANRWLAETGGTSGAEYAARFAELEAAGEDVHGEAAAVDALLPRGARVLDAGCGTGRVALELARRGHLVTGVDVDASMLAEARRADPSARWVLGDLLEVGSEDVGAPLDAVVLAGNVLVYLAPGTEADVVARLAGWLRPGGLLVAGFAADRHVAPADLGRWAEAAGLEPVASWGGWAGEPPGGGWSVQVHRRSS